MVAHRERCIGKARLDITAGQPGILRQHIFYGVAGSQEFQDGLHGDARALNNRLPIADVGGDDDSATDPFYISVDLAGVSNW